MDKKRLYIIRIATGLAALILITMIVIVIKSNQRQWVKLFEGSQYPCAYRLKDGNVILKLKSKAAADREWEVSADSEGFVEIDAKGKDTGKKASFIIAPKTPGMTFLTFSKSTEIAGFRMEAVSIEIPVLISESKEGLWVECLDGCMLHDRGGMAGGTATDQPYVLVNGESGTGEILFPAGNLDWEMTEDNHAALLDWAVSGEGSICYVSENTPLDEMEGQASDEEAGADEAFDDASDEASDEGKTEGEEFPDEDYYDTKTESKAESEAESTEEQEDEPESAEDSIKPKGAEPVFMHDRNGNKMTVLTLTNQKSGVTEYVRVVFGDDGSIKLSITKNRY